MAARASSTSPSGASYALSLVNSGAGSALRSTFPFAFSGSACSSTITLGTM